MSGPELELLWPKYDERPKPSSCSASRLQLAKMLSKVQGHPGHPVNGRPAPARPQIRFYLYDSGPFFFNDIIECATRVLGTAPDLKTNPATAEHLTDLGTIEALRSHPARVADVADADLKVIGVPVYLSYHVQHAPEMAECRAFLEKKHPKGSAQAWRARHDGRMEHLAAALLAEPAFTAREGRDFLLVFSW